MADKQVAPQEGSVEEAHEALLSLLEPEKETPESEEAKPTEEEESTEETQDESLDEESEEEDEAEAEEEEAEEESEESDDEDGEALYAVTINGEEQEVTLTSLRKAIVASQITPERPKNLQKTSRILLNWKPSGRKRWERLSKKGRSIRMLWRM